jgi:hypothetical protein
MLTVPHSSDRSLFVIDHLPGVLTPTKFAERINENDMKENKNLFIDLI